MYIFALIAGVIGLGLFALTLWHMHDEDRKERKRVKDGIAEAIYRQACKNPIRIDTSRRR